MLQSYILFYCTKTVAERYFEGRNNNNYLSSFLFPKFGY